jgi:hypothetical protein
MTKTEFAKLEAETRRLVSGNATASALAKAFAPLAARLSPTEKIAAVLHFADRDARVRAKNGTGDWLAWYFVHGAIRGAVKLPWTEREITHLLSAIAEESHAIPPEFVARTVASYVKERPLDAKLRKLALAAAKSMWPPGATEGANFKKAAEKIRAVVGT